VHSPGFTCAGSARARCLTELRLLLRQHEGLRESLVLAAERTTPPDFFTQQSPLLSRSCRMEIRRGAGRFLLM
jgi:hypothetical protein